jgi:hypothetical protein
MIDKTEIINMVKKLKDRLKTQKIRYMDEYDKLKEVKLARLSLRVENGEVYITDIDVAEEQ